MTVWVMVVWYSIAGWSHSYRPQERFATSAQCVTAARAKAAWMAPLGVLPIIHCEPVKRNER
jgi:hypothetical protein